MLAFVTPFTRIVPIWLAAPVGDGQQRIAGSADRAFGHTRGKISRGDTQCAQIDPVLGGRCAARGIEAVDDVGAEIGRVVDNRVEAAADVDGIVAGIADDRVVIVAAGDGVVAEPAVDQVVAVAAVQGIRPCPAKDLVGLRHCR